MRYHELIAALADAASALETDADPVEQAARSLRAVMRFLSDDPGLVTTNITRPIDVLHAALHDLMAGADPPLFRSRAPGGRPTNLYSHLQRAHIASALDVLVQYGHMRVVTAARWLEEEGKKQGLSIPAKQVRRWREEASAGTAPANTVESYRKLTGTHREIRDRLSTPITAQERARTILLNVWRHDSREPPPVSRVKK